MKNKNLVIVSHKKHKMNPFRETVQVDGGFFDITTEIAGHFGHVKLCVPVDYDRSVLGKRYPSNIEVIPLPFYKNRKNFIVNLPRIYCKLQRAVRGCDLIYAMGPDDMGIIALAIARFSRKPTFVSFDTDRASRVKTMNYGAFEKTVKVLFNKLIIYPYFRSLAGSIPAFITGNMFLGNYRHWYQWVKTTHRANQVLGPMSREFSHDNIKLCFAGRLSPEKNIPLLIEATSLLRQEGINVSLAIIGSGPEERRLRELVHSFGLEKAVHFKGRVTSDALLESNFLGADILVLPSLEERQGKVLVEAMARRIPVVASSIGGIPSIISHGQNGLLFDPSSVEELVDSIKALIFNRELRSHLIEKGNDFARSNTLEAGVEKLIKIVREHYFSEENVSR